ncbi:MAG: hypothetical protein MUC51_11095 [Anaerolineae bacterium]|jgi:serine acetyltransferase|nr:hypothetical protein [Anaerolineae bacterium]
MNNLSRRREDQFARHRVFMAIALELCNLLLHVLLFGAALAPLALLLPKAEGPTQLLAALGASLALGAVGFLAAIIVLVRVIIGGWDGSGELPLGSRTAARWGLAMMVWMIFRKSPIKSLVHGFAALRHLVYASTGGELHWSAVVGLGVDITDPWATRVGPGATLGDYCILNAHEISGGVANCAPILIEPYVTVGHHAAIGPGVVVERGAIVGSGAIVTKNTRVPAGEVWGGIPARCLATSDRRKPGGRQS